MKIDQQLDQLSRKLRQVEQSNEQLFLSGAKLTILRMIQQYNPVTLKDLAIKQNVALPTISKIINELLKKGLVIRAQAKEDARKRWIVPTQKGLTQLKQAESESKSYWDEKLSKLSPKQIKQLQESLDLLIKSL